MHNDQALEDNGPRRVAQAVGEGAKYLRDAGFSRVRGDQDMLDVFGLWGGKLHVRVSRPVMDPSQSVLCSVATGSGEDSACLP